MRALALQQDALLLGAFEGDRLLAHATVIHGDDLARFQWVVTAATARGRRVDLPTA
jgi:hypothetical protein